MDDMLKDNDFFRRLFDIIPAMVLIADSEGRVKAINSAAKNLFGITDEQALNQKGGDVFHCIHRTDDPRGCGFGPHCERCVVRMTAMEAMRGNAVGRAKGRIILEIDDAVRTLNLLVSAAPLDLDAQRLAVVLIEDISDIIELRGLLPICASCKKIRDDAGYWTIVEEYVRKRSEAEFTHGLCPECLEVMMEKQQHDRK